MRVRLSMPGLAEGAPGEVVDLEDDRARQLVRYGKAQVAEAVRPDTETEAPKRRTRKATSQ